MAATPTPRPTKKSPASSRKRELSGMEPGLRLMFQRKARKAGALAPASRGFASPTTPQVALAADAAYSNLLPGLVYKRG